MRNVTKATYQIFIMRIFLHFLTEGFKLTNTRLKPLNLLKLYSFAQQNGMSFVVFPVRTMKVSSIVHMYSTVHMYSMSFVTKVFELGIRYIMAKGHKKLN